MLYGPNGQAVYSQVHSRPEPQPDAEERVRTMLKSIDSLLDVKWYHHAIWNEREKAMEGRYALVCRWPYGDKRWELYQSGQIEDPVDMLGWFCEDIHDATSIPVDVDSIERKVVELLGKCDGERMSHTKRMRQIVEKNAKVRQQHRAPITDSAQEMAESLFNLSRTVKTHKLEKIMQELGG